MQYHEYANLFSMMSEAEYAALLQDMRQNGYDMTAPIATYAGAILDGRNRWKAAQELGITPPTLEYGGDDPLAFVIRHNLTRRHLNESQRAVVAARLATMGAGRPQKSENYSANLPNNISQTQAAEMLNASERTIQRVKAVEREAPELVPMIEAGNLSAYQAYQQAKAPRPHVANNSGNNEWYTPAEYVEAARRVMGGIDLDPASSAIANRVVQASRYYTAEDDGLGQEWGGRVWMNPPYASDLIGRFADKLCAELKDGHICAAIVLVNNATETKWFQQMLCRSSATCFLLSRVRFWQPGGELGAPLQGQAVLYFGEDIAGFAAEFDKLGVCMATYGHKRSDFS